MKTKRQLVNLTVIGRYTITPQGQTVAQAIQQGGYVHIDHDVNEKRIKVTTFQPTEILLVRAPVGTLHDNIIFTARKEGNIPATAFDTLVLCGNEHQLSDIVSLDKFSRCMDAQLNLHVRGFNNEGRYLKAFPGGHHAGDDAKVVHETEVFAFKAT